MPASFLKRHRTICAVLQEIQNLAEERGDMKTITLCIEATDYAKRMSAKLVEYKHLMKQEYGDDDR